MGPSVTSVSHYGGSEIGGIPPVSQMRKPEPGEFKDLVQSEPAGNWLADIPGVSGSLAHS